MRIISNEEFDIAYNNADNIKIMNKAGMSYSKNLKSRLKECKMLALWEALRDFKSDRGMKFTTFLFYKVRRVCYDAHYSKAEKISEFTSIEDSFSGCTSDSTFIQDIMMSLNDKDGKLISDRFVHRKTLREIGKEHNVSPEMTSQRIDAVLRKLKKILS